MARNRTPSQPQRRQEMIRIERPFAPHFTVSQMHADRDGIKVDGTSKTPQCDVKITSSVSRDIMLVTEESRRKHEEFMKYMYERKSLPKQTRERCRKSQSSIVNSLSNKI